MDDAAPADADPFEPELDTYFVERLTGSDWVGLDWGSRRARTMTSGAGISVRPTGREHLTATYPAAPATVPLLRRALAELAAGAGATEAQVQAVRLAVSEALTNAALHAYREDPGPVHVSAHLAGSELWVIIADDGCGLRPVPNSPGLGVGLAVIADVCDDFAIVTRSSGGVEVRMRFNIGPESMRPGGRLRGSDASVRRAAWPIFSTMT